VGRQLIEATLLAMLGGTLSVLVAGPARLRYNRFVADTDIALVVTGESFLITFGATLFVRSSRAQPGLALPPCTGPTAR